MVDETKKGVKKSNKTKIGLKRSILDEILPSFVIIWRFLKQKIGLALRFFPNFKNSRCFNHFTSGYVQVLAVMAIPGLLFGAKYLLDNRTLVDRNATRGTGGERFVKQCAKNASLEVAKKWNPALTYAQQKIAMLRIADQVYNTSKTYLDSPLVQAVHGINMPKKVTTKGGAYDPLKLAASAESLQTEFKPEKKQIAQNTETTNTKRYYFYHNYSARQAPMALYHFDIMYQSLNRENVNLFSPDEDLYEDYVYYCNNNDSNPSGSSWYHYVTWPEVIGIYNPSGSTNVGTRSYTIRESTNDEPVKIEPVKIEIEDDKIKVTTDDDVACAVPAECNVDIILTVPTNSAALNPYNLDKNTPEPGTPYISTSKTSTDEAKSTPIYQITRAYQKFLKNNFFYTRGVNVGVIPYSGKVSLRSDRLAWVKAPDRFVDDGNTNIVGAALYGTKGEKGEKLTEIGSFAGGRLSYGLLCRGNTEDYGSNKITKGDLLSAANPENSDSDKFRKMVYNPCCSTDANLLSMTCESDGNKYWMNPYFILELNPDVKFIYNMLGAFYPYYDDRNVSNFTFIPLTWANNLLQSWSATGENEAVNTSDDSTNLGRLSTPSKTTSGRKKALILIVNKPDWFEPGELTYLGFDNDYSETLAVESDLIRFDKETSGAKGILKYKYDSSQGILSFPRKGLLRIVVEPTSSTAKIKFTNVVGSYPSATKDTSVTKRSEFFIIPDQIKDNNNNYYVGITLTNIKLVSAEITNRPYEVDKSEKVVYTALTAPKRSVYIDLLKKSFDQKFVYNVDGKEKNMFNYHLIYGKDYNGNMPGIQYQDLTYTPPAQTTPAAIAPTFNSDASENPVDWKIINIKTDYKWNSVCYGKVNGKGRFVAVSGGDPNMNGNKSNVAAYSDDGETWHKSILPSLENWQSVCYGNGKFAAVAYDSKIFAYSDDGETWKKVPYGEYAEWKHTTWASVAFAQHYKLSTNGPCFVGVNTNDTNVAWIVDKTNDIYVLSDSTGIPKIFYTISSYKDTLIGTDGTSVFKHNYNNNTWEQKSNLAQNGHFLKSLLGQGDNIFAMSYGGKFYGWRPSFDSFETWGELADLPKSEGKDYYWISMCSGEYYYLGYKIPCIVAVANGRDSRPGTLARYTYDAVLSGTWQKTESDNTVTNQQWESVCWGEVKVNGEDVGRFVAVSGANNVAAYSDDGLNWTKVSISASLNFKSVCYGNGKFVAFGNKEVVYSTDGINWQEDESNVIIDSGGEKSIAAAVPGKWRSVCYGDGKFVAISDQVGRLYGTVEDWKLIPGGRDYKMSSICYGDGKFMMVGENSSTSWCAPSGKFIGGWSEATLVDQNTKSWTSVCYGNGKFVAASNDGYLVYSTDGNSWSTVISEEATSIPWTSVCYGNGKFVAANKAGYFAHSTDGNSWSRVMLMPPVAPWTSVCYGNGKFVAVSQKNSQGKSYISYSSDGIDWSVLSSSPQADWRSVCYSGKLGRFVAVGDDGAIAYCDVKVEVKYFAIGDNSGAYSSDGIDWYEIGLYTSSVCRSVCYGKGEFIAVGGEYIYGTSNGLNWETRNKSSSVWRSVCYGNRTFVAVSKKNLKGISYISYSIDGKTWTEVITKPISTGSWDSVCYGNGKFVAVGNEKAAYSTDNGKTWEEVTEKPISEGSWRSVCYGNKKFIAVGNGKAAYSTDGKNWTKVDTESTFNGFWDLVCYGDGKFVAVGLTEVAYSTDGINWTKVDTEPISTGQWKSVCYGDGKFVAVGRNNMALNSKVIYSSDGEIWKESILSDPDFMSVAAVRDEEPEIKPIERGWYFYNNDPDANKNDSTNHHFIFPTNPGDMYFVTNSEEFTYENGNIYPMVDANGFFIDVGNIYFNVNDGTVKKYLGSGLYRWTMPAEKATGIKLTSNANARQFTWSVKNLGKVSLPTLYAGATLPINAALFTGGWQSDGDGENWNGVDATTAVKEVTKAASVLLKSMGDNLRIYLIKYRAQGKADDYSYLDNCASASYDVSDESELEKKLQDIAEEIANWAERTEAKNVY